MKYTTLFLFASVLYAQPQMSMKSVVSGGKANVVVSVVGLGTTPTGAESLQFTVSGFPLTSGPTWSPSDLVMAQGKTVDCGLTTTSVGCIISGITSNKISDGWLATLSFTAPSSPVTLSMSGTLGASPDAAAVTITPSVPVVVMPVVSPCDVNSDGAVNQADYDAVRRSATGQSTVPHDLNGDSKTDVLDLQIIVNAIVGKGCQAVNPH